MNEITLMAWFAETDAAHEHWIPKGVQRHLELIVPGRILAAPTQLSQVNLTQHVLLLFTLSRNIQHPKA